jgi:hypothetical protein
VQRADALPQPRGEHLLELGQLINQTIDKLIALGSVGMAIGAREQLESASTSA